MIHELAAVQWRPGQDARFHHKEGAPLWQAFRGGAHRRARQPTPEGDTPDGGRTRPDYRV